MAAGERPEALPPRPRLVKEVEAVPESLADLERHYYGPAYLGSLYRG